MTPSIASQNAPDYDASKLSDAATIHEAERAGVRRLVNVAAAAANEKLGRDVVVLDVEALLVITDAFVITSGNTDRQVKAIVEEVEKRVKLAGGGGPLRIEGLSNAKWVLMDYGDFVVHVFDHETREYYDLEHLWLDAPRLAWQ